MSIGKEVHDSRDSSGGLTNKLVTRDFWPACQNCRHHETCHVGPPRHGAFPHQWHWAREVAEFRDGSILVLQSWVGTPVFGEEHTGCYDYQVAPEDTYDLEVRHLEYLATWAEADQIAHRLEEFEAMEDKHPGYVMPAEYFALSDTWMALAKRLVSWHDTTHE